MIVTLCCDDVSGQFSFGRHERLQRSEEYERVKREGRRVKGRSLIVNYLPNGLPYHRLGLVVPRKYYRNAVARNHLKRCVREWFRLNKAHLACPCKDIVVVVLPGITSVRCGTVYEELESICVRLNCPK